MFIGQLALTRKIYGELAKIRGVLGSEWFQREASSLEGRLENCMPHETEKLDAEDFSDFEAACIGGGGI